MTSLAARSPPVSPFRRALLQTAVVDVCCGSAGPVRCRALFDSVSEQSFATRSLTRRLKVAAFETKQFAVEGFGDRSTLTKEHERVNLLLQGIKTRQESRRRSLLGCEIDL